MKMFEEYKPKRERIFTREDMLYVTGYTNNEEQFDNLLLLGGWEPEGDDYIELMKDWYESMRTAFLRYEYAYYELKEQITRESK